MKLMYELSTPEVEVTEELNEASGAKNKKYKIKGVFSTIGEKNRNGRTYPRHLWETNVRDYQNNFSSGSINTLCEWQHPARTEVDPMEAVAKIEKLEIKDNYVIGEAVILDNPKGQQIKTLIDNGVKISVSSRGVGNVKNGIVENFKLVTYDLVSSPSDYNATMNGMVESHQLNEGVIEDLEFTIDVNGNIVQGKDLNESECKDNVCEMFNKEDIEKVAAEKFKDLLTSLAESYKIDLNESEMRHGEVMTYLNWCFKSVEKNERTFDKNQLEAVQEYISKNLK